MSGRSIGDAAGRGGADEAGVGGAVGGTASPADAAVGANGQDAIPQPVERLSFDAALLELQEIVSRLETGGLPLETSISLYERGVALHARCARLLGEAELRVQQLVEQAGGTLAAIDLAPDDEDDGPEPGA